MNENFKNGISFGLILLVLLLGSSCSTIMETDGDAIALPMIEKIEKYKTSNGHYPNALTNLIPEFMGQYDFQAYRYQHFSALGQDLEKLISKGLIRVGQGDGYELAVSFQKYTGQCIYINGKRQSCHYTGR